MNRPSVERRAVTALGGATAVVALVTLMSVSSSGLRIAYSGWAVPLVVGGSVGLLAWLVFAGIGRGGSRGAQPVVVRCESCGAEVRAEWRLCPYCGGSNDSGKRRDSVREASELEA